ncbi:MAG: hypothetical protein A2Y95_03795 [Deltaproteobacteria bacterium RBG_13_65_10]|nr:MAG: hypothetical protein A2Y95_03795 [Deltaproteobacteria bacterium RBG_13_65_10]
MAYSTSDSHHRDSGPATQGNGEGRTNGLGSPNGYPALRRDLEIVPRPAKRAYVVRDPESGETFELGEKEFFLLGQFDGHTSPGEIRTRFERRYEEPVASDIFDAFLRQMLKQGIMVAAGAPAIPETFGDIPGAIWRSPRWLSVDAVFTAIAENVRWCFTRTVAVMAGAVIALGFGVILRYWGDFFGDAKALLKVGEFPLLMVVGMVLFLSFLQSVSTGVSCKVAGARVRSFDLHFYWYLLPVFRCDMGDVPLIWSKSDRYRTTYAGLVAQTFGLSVGAILWTTTPPTAPLREVWLVATWVLITFLPWNPMVQRNAYFFLSEWLEVPNLMSRAKVAAWRWIFGLPESDPCSRNARIGFRVYGVLWFLYAGTLVTILGGVFVPFMVHSVDVTGFALLLVVGAFLLEFPIRKELMRFEPFSAWMSRNDGKSTMAWMIRMGLGVLFVLVMLLPYPYEPGGNLRILPVAQQGIRTRITGKLAAVLVDEGQLVEKGQIVAVIDPREQQRNLDIAEANLTSAQAQLDLIKLGSKPEDIAKAREQAAAAERDYYYAKIEADRMRQLYEQNVVSLGLYDQKRKQRDVDQKLYAAAKENVALVMSGAREPAIEAQRAEVDRLSALVKDAKEDLALTVIQAPAKGRIVTPRPKDRIGQVLAMGDLIASVEDARTLRAEVEVPEQTTNRIRVGAQVKVRAWTYPLRTFEGTVESIAPVVMDKKKEGKVDYVQTEREDSLSRATTAQQGKVVRVLVTILNPDGLLKSEMTGYAKVRTRYEPFGLVMTHGIVRFFLVEVWSWIP